LKMETASVYGGNSWVTFVWLLVFVDMAVNWLVYFIEKVVKINYVQTNEFAKDE
jgi:hypothetical protein